MAKDIDELIAEAERVIAETRPQGLEEYEQWISEPAPEPGEAPPELGHLADQPGRHSAAIAQWAAEMTAPTDVRDGIENRVNRRVDATFRILAAQAELTAFADNKYEDAPLETINKYRKRLRLPALKDLPDRPETVLEGMAEASELPYISGIEAVKDFLQNRAALERWDANEETVEDVEYIAKTMEGMARDHRDSPFRADFGKIISSSAPFALEFVAAGGLLSAAKRGVTTLADDLAEGLVKRTIRGFARLPRQAAARTALMPTRVAGAIAERRTPLPELSPEDLNLIINEPDESFMESIAKGGLDVYTEVLSELLGGAIPIGAGGRLISRIPVPEIKTRFMARAVGGMKGGWKAGRQMLRKLGIDSVVAEMGEERAKDVMDEVLGIRDVEMPDAEQLAVEFAAFMAMGSPVIATAAAPVLARNLADFVANKPFAVLRKIADAEPTRKAFNALGFRQPKNKQERELAKQLARDKQREVIRKQVSGEEAPALPPGTTTAVPETGPVTPEAPTPQVTEEAPAEARPVTPEPTPAPAPGQQPQAPPVVPGTPLDPADVTWEQRGVPMPPRVVTPSAWDRPRKGQAKHSRVLPNEMAEPAEVKAWQDLLTKMRGITSVVQSLEGRADEGIALEAARSAASRMPGVTLPTHLGYEAIGSGGYVWPLQGLVYSINPALQTYRPGTKTEEVRRQVPTEPLTGTTIRPADPLGTPEGQAQAAQSQRAKFREEADIRRAGREAGVGVVPPGMPAPQTDQELIDQVRANPDETVRERIAQAKRIRRRETMWDRILDGLRTARRKLKPREFLPTTAEYAVADELFRLQQEIPNRAVEVVQKDIAAVTDNLTVGEFELFESTLIYRNMKASMERGEQGLRFGEKNYNSVVDELNRLQALVAQRPTVQQALNMREQTIREYVQMAVERKILPEKALENVDNYYHQMVKVYVELRKHNTILSGARTPKKTKRSWQKERKKVDQDGKQTLNWSTDYDYVYDFMESELTWATQNMMDVMKHDWLQEMNEQYGILNQLRRRAEEETGDPENWGAFTPEGFDTYSYFTESGLPSALGNRLETFIIDGMKLSNEQKDLFMSLNGAKKMVLPTPIVQELEKLAAQRPPQILIRLERELLSMWKQWTLFRPGRVIQYNLRNLTGDIDPIIATGHFGIFPRMWGGWKELRKYYAGELSETEDLRAMIDHGTIDAGFTQQEVGDELKKSERFQHLYDKRGMKRDIPGWTWWWRVSKRYSSLRENVPRHAAFMYFKEKLEKGELKDYGASRPEFIREIHKRLGVDAAAARLSRDLIGDYGNLTVMGNWLRAHLVPFHAFQELNLRRYGRITLNNLQRGRLLAAAGQPLHAVFNALLMSRLFWTWAMYHLYNITFMGDEERDLANYDRANPHINLGRTEDGSVRVFRNVGALGDVLEWGGFNTMVSLLRTYDQGQLDGVDILREMLKDPVNKGVASIRPEIKAFYEVMTGQSVFPDFFNPRSQARDEALVNVIGAVDWYRQGKGFILSDGSRGRRNWGTRMLVGVVDPRRNAMNDTYDLYRRFLNTKGEDLPPPRAKSEARYLRYSLADENFTAFREAKRKYEEKGKGWDNFKKSMTAYDPIKRKHEAEFAKWINPIQRERVRAARQYASELLVRGLDYWLAAEAFDEQEALEIKIGGSGVGRKISEEAAKLTAPKPPKGLAKSRIRQLEAYESRRQEAVDWFRQSGLSGNAIIAAFRKSLLDAGYPKPIVLNHLRRLDRNLEDSGLK